jgi:hypothetical protein
MHAAAAISLLFLTSWARATDTASPVGEYTRLSNVCGSYGSLDDDRISCVMVHEDKLAVLPAEKRDLDFSVSFTLHYDGMDVCSFAGVGRLGSNGSTIQLADATRDLSCRLAFDKRASSVTILDPSGQGAELLCPTRAGRIHGRSFKRSR